MKIHHFEELGSTNDHLLAMAEKGAPEWTVVTADVQTSGRGRKRRNWWSPKGNLHMSILLRPEVSPRQLLRLPVIATLAFLHALGDSASRLKIKWPNDILLDGRKMTGILTESRTEGQRVLSAVVGFGVNMTREVGYIPVPLKGRMAFVHELDGMLEPRDLALRIAQSMKEGIGALHEDKWNDAAAEWSQRALLKVPYLYRDGERQIKGLPVRLDTSGGLVLKTDKGEVTVYSGELEQV